MIRNMGLFWRRDNVFWDRQRNPGSLFGVPSDARRDEPTDFWDQVGIYALYANYNLVYVGQTGQGVQNRLGVRLRQHTDDDLAGRWDSFSWFGIRFVTPRNQLAAVPNVRNLTLPAILDLTEGILIAVGEPSLNRQRGRFGNDVERYLQIRDQRLDE
jgi:hypothetical protein